MRSFVILQLIVLASGTGNLNQYFSSSSESDVDVANALGEKGIAVSTQAPVTQLTNQNEQRNGTNN